MADYSKHALFSRIHLMLIAQMKVSTEKRCILRGKRMTGLSIQVRQAPAPWIGEKEIKLLSDASHAKLGGKTQGHEELS